MLLSGTHLEIGRWRRRQSLLATRGKRPDQLEQAERDGRLTAHDRRILDEES